VTQLPAQTPPPAEPELPGKESGQSWREKLNSIGTSSKLRGGGEGGTLVTEGYPSINLVSPAIIEQQEARRLVRRFVYIGLVMLLLVAGGWFLINQLNSGASADLANASSQLTTKSHTLGKLKSITGINAVLSQNESDISKQLQTEAYTSRVMKQFLDSFPKGTSVSNYSLQMLSLADLKAPAGAGTVNANDPCGSDPNPFQEKRMIGCIRFQGNSISYDLALRLNSLIKGQYLAQVYVGGITRDPQTGTWQFNGSTAITPDALSARYNDGDTLKKGLLDGTIPGQAPDASASPTPAAGG